MLSSKKYARFVLKLLAIVAAIITLLFNADNIIVTLSNLKTIKSKPFSYSDVFVEGLPEYKSNERIFVTDIGLKFSHPFSSTLYLYNFNGDIKRKNIWDRSSTETFILENDMLKVSIDKFYKWDTENISNGRLPYKKLTYLNKASNETTVLNEYYKLSKLHYNDAALFDVEITDKEAREKYNKSLNDLKSIDGSLAVENERPLKKTLYYYDLATAEKKEILSSDYIEIYPFETYVIIGFRDYEDEEFQIQIFDVSTGITKEIAKVPAEKLEIIYGNNESIYYLDGDDTFWKLDVESFNISKIEEEIEFKNRLDELLCLKNIETNTILTFDCKTQTIEEVFRLNSDANDVLLVNNDLFLVYEKNIYPNPKKMEVSWYSRENSFEPELVAKAKGSSIEN